MTLIELSYLSPTEMVSALDANLPSYESASGFRTVLSILLLWNAQQTVGAADVLPISLISFFFIYSFFLILQELVVNVAVATSRRHAVLSCACRFAVRLLSPPEHLSSTSGLFFTAQFYTNCAPSSEFEF